MITTLIIGAIELPTLATHVELTQSYDDILPIRFRRTADNTGILRSTGSAKLRTVIQGRGWVPALEDIDTTTTQVVKCAMHRAANSATTTVSLPAARRADTGHQPLAYGRVGDDLIATTITNLAAILAGSTDEATLTAVSGASAYVVHYWPQITAAVLVKTGQGASSAAFEWTIEAEEV